MIRKSKKLKIGIGIAIVFSIVGTVGALNGWFGGGGEIPSDTFTRGLVGYWSFDEGSGTTAYDVSGNGNNGTLTNGPKWTKGKSGTALSFDGVDDYIDCGNDESLNITDEITIEVWIKPNDSSANEKLVGNGDPIGESRGGYQLEKIYGGIYCEIWDSSGDLHEFNTSGQYSSGEWVHLVMTWETGGEYAGYVNGEKVHSENAGNESIGTTSNTVKIGTAGWNSFYFNGLIDEVRIYNRALTAEEIRYHYNRGGPVAHWKFDEGSGGIIYDATDNNNDGALHLGTSDNTATGSAWVVGKHGSALKFDGVDDYVEAPDSASLDTESLTIVVWFKLNQNPDCDGSNNYRSFMRKGSIAGTSDGWDIVLEEDGDVCFDVSGTRWWPLGRAKQLLGWPIGEWHFYAFTYDANTGVMKFYKDGKFIDSHTKTPGSIISNTASIAISKGANAVSCPSGSGFVPGEYDDVRIYNYARTPDEIRLDYNAGLAAHFGPGTSCDEDPGSCMTKGLVGYWSFDESAGQTAYDASDQGNNGTIHGAKWAKGKEGSALSFDGVDDYVDCGNDESLNITDAITVMAWVKPSAFGDFDRLVMKYHVFNLRFDHQYPHFYVLKDGSIYHALANTKLSTNIWYHVVGTWGGNKLRVYVNGNEVSYSTQDSVIAPIDSNSYHVSVSNIFDFERFHGLIDEVRIYNRALSEEEIRYHYNHTLPKGAASPTAMKEDSSLVGYWSFNEGSGQIAYDKSGNGNNGTIHGAAWAAGKSGSALSFDGSNDYVDCGSDENFNLTQLTMELWIRTPSSMGQTWRNVLSKRISGDRDFGFWMHSSDNVKVDGLHQSSHRFGSWVAYLSTPFEPNTWHHVVMTIDSTGLQKAYADGKKVGQYQGTAGNANNSYPVWIARADNYFNGLIDEVRIYNRALTEKEIQEHYRESKYYLASKFGPGTDCDTDPGFCMDYGLVGYWSFDEGSGTTAYDASGNGNNGTLTNGPKWTKGKFGTALQFDGDNDYVDTPYAGYNSPHTILVWAKTNELNPSNDKYLLDNSWGTVGYIMRQNHNTNDMFFYIYWNNSGLKNVLIDIPDLGWHLYAFQWTDTAMRVSIDAGDWIETTFASDSVATPSDILQIGSPVEHWGNLSWNGLIDEVRIYNRALSEEEIRYHYNRGRPVAHWSFDEGEGNTAYDSTDNNNDGTIHGAAWVAGKYGSALSFDGQDDYVEAAVTQTKTTYSLWIKPAAGVWEHVVKIGSTYYVNGVKGVSPTAFPIYVSGDTVQIGKTDAATYFNGLIDDVRIYNYERTQSQILQDYNAGLSTHFR